jgi:hypothetical protein
MNDSKASFNAHRDAEKRIESAKNTIKVLLSAELYEPHLVELLKICIWKLSLAEGRSKYKTRYKSVGSGTVCQKNGFGLNFRQLGAKFSHA